MSSSVRSFPGGDWAGSGSENALVVLVGVVIVVLVVVPMLLFGIELVIVGVLLAASLAGRILLGRPWTVEARSVGGVGAERRLEWSVPGWRRSREFIESVERDLVAGREPDPV